jgi:phosphatidylinositol dimannoside acyltransferase
LKSCITRLRLEIRDALELMLLPALAALVPWNLGYRLLRWISRTIRPYAPTTNEALEQASNRGWVGDEKHWTLVRRIVTLVDHADLYLAKSRSDAWMLKYLDVQGQWPQPGEPGLICTFHWGAGMWGLRHACASGLKAHALVAPLQGEHFAGRRVLLAYARARTAEVARSLGCATLDISASLRPALQALKRGDQVIAAIDVPADQVSSSEEIDFLGTRARVPRGLLRLAVDQRLPVTVYLTGLNVDSGRRFLRIHQLGVPENLQQLMTKVFSYLEEAIRTDPPAWHFWSEAPRIFVTDDGASAG